MPDDIKINKEYGVIEIRSFGKVSMKDIESSIKRVKQIHEEIGIDKVLVDTTEQESMPSTINIFEIFSKFPRDVKVALLTNICQITSQDIHFAETVAQNRGIRINEFEAQENALNWLTT